MITPPPYYDISDQDIVNTIKTSIENGEHNLYVFPKGCVDEHRLYDFIKGIHDITLTIIIIIIIIINFILFRQITLTTIIIIIIINFILFRQRGGT
jgi:hypothetical protein